VTGWYASLSGSAGSIDGYWDSAVDQYTPEIFWYRVERSGQAEVEVEVG
jgi:hypothetical protein